MREVARQLDTLIVLRIEQPIRDRQEAVEDLTLRVSNMGDADKRRWREGMLEIAAYAIYAALSDQ